MGKAVLEDDQFAGKIDQRVDPRLWNPQPSARRIFVCTSVPIGLAPDNGLGPRLFGERVASRAFKRSEQRRRIRIRACAVARRRDRLGKRMQTRVTQRVGGASRRRPDPARACSRPCRRPAASRAAPGSPHRRSRAMRPAAFTRRRTQGIGGQIDNPHLVGHMTEHRRQPVARPFRNRIKSQLAGKRIELGNPLLGRALDTQCEQAGNLAQQAKRIVAVEEASGMRLVSRRRTSSTARDPRDPPISLSWAAIMPATHCGKPSPDADPLRPRLVTGGRATVPPSRALRRRLAAEAHRRLRKRRPIA